MRAPAETEVAARGSGTPREPWSITPRVGWLLVLLFCAAFLNYVDRQLLSVLKPIIKIEFGIDDRGYAAVVNAFTFCYAGAYMVTGWVIDRFGVRVYAGFLALWSLATIAGGLARSLFVFTGCRAVLGLAEPAHVPTTIRVGVLWFPTSRRAFLMTIAAWGGTIGVVAAPPLISWLALEYSWRAAFLIPVSRACCSRWCGGAFIATPQRHRTTCRRSRRCRGKNFGRDVSFGGSCWRG